MNIKRILEEANAEFFAAGIRNYFYETRELLGVVLGKTKEWIVINPGVELSDEDYEKFIKLKKERIQGRPFQYILGEQYFMGLKFFVDENVLIPRADTEILVYKVLEMIKDRENVKILDMCTGSGCIAISLAKLRENAEVFAADISEEALKVAKKNSEMNQVDVKFFQSDLFENVPNEGFDIIVSNPPYIASEEMKNLAPDVLREPHSALDGGDDGLDFYGAISESAFYYLKDGGIIVFEIGYDQAERVTDILKELKYKNIELIKDYSNNDRVLVAVK